MFNTPACKIDLQKVRLRKYIDKNHYIQYENKYKKVERYWMYSRINNTVGQEYTSSNYEEVKKYNIKKMRKNSHGILRKYLPYTMGVDGRSKRGEYLQIQ